MLFGQTRRGDCFFLVCVYTRHVVFPQLVSTKPRRSYKSTYNVDSFFHIIYFWAWEFHNFKYEQTPKIDLSNFVCVCESMSHIFLTFMFDYCQWGNYQKLSCTICYWFILLVDHLCQSHNTPCLMISVLEAWVRLTFGFFASGKQVAQFL